jgi:hypothetical protein
VQQKKKEEEEEEEEEEEKRKKKSDSKYEWVIWGMQWKDSDYLIE